MFVARSEELSQLSEAMKKSNHATLVYGKRRVGKTRLIREAAGVSEKYFVGLKKMIEKCSDWNYTCNIFVCSKGGNQIEKESMGTGSECCDGSGSRFRMRFKEERDRSANAGTDD